MIASLVLIFPTPHEGGALAFRHQGKEWTFESSKRLFESATHPSAETANLGYAAFFSDVEHEVFQVTSGHRVTITYNLYLGKTALSRSINPKSDKVRKPSPESQDKSRPLEEALRRMLAKPSFIPDGGYLGFGLVHQYPLEKGLHDIPDIQFKGKDALVARALRSVGLTPLTRIVYDLEWYGSVMTDYVYFSRDGTEDISDALRTGYGRLEGLLIAPPKEEEDAELDAVVEWVTPLTKQTQFEQDYAAWGNSASLDMMYGNICIVAQIESVGRRKIAG